VSPAAGPAPVPAERARLPLLVQTVLRELGGPLAVWVAFLFLLLFVMQFLRGTDVLLGSAVTLADYGRLGLNLAPHFLVMSLPVGLLLAVLLGLGRMAEDRELLALGALGSPPWQVARVPLALAAVIGAFILLLASTAEPWGLKQVKQVVAQVIKRNVLGDVKPGVFYEDLTNLTLYARGVDARRGVWTQVLVHDERDPRAPLLVLANEGKVSPEG
jgi:lipopolysaccharide export system permease protein